MSDLRLKQAIAGLLSAYGQQRDSHSRALVIKLDA
jgi:hypothetical protein